MNAILFRIMNKKFFVFNLTELKKSYTVKICYEFYFICWEPLIPYHIMISSMRE